MAPAPAEIAVQAYSRGTLPTMLAKLQSGQSIKEVQDWAQDELEGFVLGAMVGLSNHASGLAMTRRFTSQVEET